MTTTPEQLSKWREGFEAINATKPMLSVLLYSKFEDGEYRNKNVESEWVGYLRAKQENEQIMKLAKFGAECIANVPPQIIARVAEAHGLMFTGEFDWEITPNIEATIKELLK